MWAGWVGGWGWRERGGQCGAPPRAAPQARHRQPNLGLYTYSRPSSLAASLPLSLSLSLSHTHTHTHTHLRNCWLDCVCGFRRPSNRAFCRPAGGAGRGRRGRGATPAAGSANDRRAGAEEREGCPLPLASQPRRGAPRSASAARRTGPLRPLAHHQQNTRTRAHTGTPPPLPTPAGATLRAASCPTPPPPLPLPPRHPCPRGTPCMSASVSSS